MDQYDVVVIGCGIHGAGMAQAAAAAGHRVLVLEKGAIGGGTSSRSSKLIHGGLRYLETGQLNLVRESLRERSILTRLAPDLVRLRDFFLPVYRRTRRRPWQLRLGLGLYAVLAGLRPETAFGTVPRRDWGGLDGLRQDDLQTVFRYRDGQTDDRRLTMAVARSAERLGAVVALEAEVLSANLVENGCVVGYRHEGVARTCATEVLVNAAGPWAPMVASKVSPPISVPDVELVQGAHILLPATIRGGVYYVESPRDGRAVFIMPNDRGVLVGTTETPFSGNPENARVSQTERHYLLSVARHYFPCLDFTTADILAETAGLRVLPAGAGHAFHRRREALLILDRPVRPRVLSIYGGKLTTYRSTANTSLRRLAPSLPDRRRVADTAHLPLGPE